MAPVKDVTRILNSPKAPGGHAAEELLEAVYDELRRLAGARMAKEGPAHTLQATALVHEAWLRISREDHSWENRAHFFSAAAKAMRRILVDRARRRLREKRGGGKRSLPLDSLRDIDLAITTDDRAVLAVDEALAKLEGVDPTGAELIRLRFFSGLTNVEAAKILGLSERTAKRTWAYARAWLLEELRRED